MNAEWLAPVEHLVVHVDDPRALAPGLERLQELVTSGVVQVLDLEVVRRVASGATADAPTSSAPTHFEAVDLGTFGDQGGVDLHAFDGTWSGLLDEADLRASLEGAGPGTAALVVVYEVVALAPVLDAFKGAAVHVVSLGSVDEQNLVAALDAMPERGTR